MQDVRKLVTLRTVDEVRPIENADRIEEVRIGGWSVVVGKGEFHAGDVGVFFEIDAALPLDNPLFTFLGERSTKTYEGRDVHVLKTARLRGVYSQGLLLPLTKPGVLQQFTQRGDILDPANLSDDLNTADYSSVFGVTKYEPTMPDDGTVIGEFPREARKTDSERVQNLSTEFYRTLNPDEWYATEKLDGMSTTFVKRNGEVLSASRNWQVSDTSPQGVAAHDLRIADVLPEGATLQGELVGEKIQGNPLKLSDRQFLVFSYDLGQLEHDEATVEKFEQFVAEHSVPVLDWELPATIEDAVQQVDGMKSTINPKVHAEGVVWWNRHGTEFNDLGGRANFKAINNKFLLKHGG